ncbi:hypothetical protein ASF83_14815 [Plantibacter sp. Leaf171]|uniref:DUF4192 family protein n=1 Tax=unclassified Plantibacter TaxID=2624265 RepID=UPI0006F99D87|nr:MULTISPECIES: DUF4192 family protein [unclassified Plantibacter]KQM14074.1 hypothetical protein ASE44_14830 [Plantibacter sp. Leaf1]KQR57456.1 hypothetical protein ASF83_14815 [Plantibacter sp. Leaf171]
MTHIVQAHAAEDLLALVPGLIGSTPRSSLVVVLFAGSRSRGALQVHLPAGTDVDRRVAEAAAEHALGFACRAPGVDAIVPVVYTDDAFGAGAEPPGRVIADAVLGLASAHGFTVKDALCSATDGWGSYLDPGLPSGGRSPAIVASAAVPPVPPLPTELVTTQVPSVDAETFAAVDLEYRLLSARLASMLDAATDHARTSWRIDVGDTVERLDGLPEVFEDALARGVGAMTPREVAFLLLSLKRPWASDLALMQWAFGRDLGEELDDAERAYGHLPIGMDDPEVFHRVAHLLVGDGPHPDVQRIRAASSLLLGVAARASESARVAPLAMLAWLAWALGQSSRAAAFLDELDATELDHPLASTVASLIRQGHLPAWAFRPSAEPVGSVVAANGQPAA